MLLSAPLSYPLPLLSLTTFLALTSTRLPRLKSEHDEDPLFDDDWDASVYLYPRESGSRQTRPPITLLVICVGDNIIFDPSREELAVAETVLAVSLSASTPVSAVSPESEMDVDERVDDEQTPSSTHRAIRLLSVRMIDPPARLTAPGVADGLNSATGGSVPETDQTAKAEEPVEGVWRARRGGASRRMVKQIMAAAVQRGGVADEVLDGLAGVEAG
jgi:exosome complex component RRP42